VTEQTVKFHLTNIYRKLGVANRTEAARYAYQHGLVESPAFEYA
jgi:DNA-binding NarL/FixJ family response regulator